MKNPCEKCEFKDANIESGKRCYEACEKLVGYNLREYFIKSGIIIKEGEGKKKKKRKKK